MKYINLKDLNFTWNSFIASLLLFVVFASPFFHLSFFYKSFHISQNISSLAALNLISVLFFCDSKRNLYIKITTPSLLLLASILIIVMSLNTAFIVLSVLLLYALIIILGQYTDVKKYSPLLLSYAAFLSSLFSFILYLSGKFGLIELVKYGRVYGNYGQPNLLAALLLIGLFSYAHLIQITKRNGFIYLLPLFVIATVLFMTASRAAMVALCLSGLVVIFFWRHPRVVSLHPIFIRLLFVLICSWGVAQFMGDWTPLSRAEAGWSEGGGTYKRLVYWLAALLMGSDNWVSGTGFGGYPANLGDYAIVAAEKLRLTYDMIGQTLWAHNDFFHIFAEHGLFVFLLLILFVLLMFRHYWQHVSSRNLFLFLALISFACMMSFGHPLYYHNLALMASLLLAPLVGHWRGRQIEIKKKYVVIFVSICLVVVNFYSFKHFYQMYNLNQFSKYMARDEGSFDDRFMSGYERYLVGNIDNPIYGWQFKYTFYQNLVNRLITDDNMVLGEFILPEMVAYSSANRFSSYLFSLAKLYYLLGDYENAKTFSRQAYERKPDRHKYFDLLHLCNALLISKNNSIQITQLISPENMTRLYDEKVLLPRQFDENDIAL